MTASATRGQKYGKDFKSFSVTVSPEEHTECKLRAIRHGVTVAEVCRLALLDPSEDVWKRAKELKESKEKEGSE